jgi:aldehyde dehydrogenase (NAD+)
MTGPSQDVLHSLDYGPAPEDPTPVLRWLEDRGRRFPLFVANRWVEPRSGRWFEARNPATGELLAHVAGGGAEDVDRAVRAAQDALPAWSRTPDPVRAQSLYALAGHVHKHRRFLAVLQSFETGRLVRESRDVDVPLAAWHFSHHAGWARLRSREFPGYEPVGVVGQILPESFPLLTLAWKLAPALAAGCTVVLKPSPQAPLTALAFCELVLAAGLPPGVVNVVPGEGSTEEALVQHPGLEQITFIGSPDAGRRIRRLAAGSGKRLSVELCGSFPFLVFEDADLDAAVEGVVDSLGLTQLQATRPSLRLLVQESVEDHLVEKLRARAERLRVGDPLDQAVDLPAVAPVRLEHIVQLSTTFRSPTEAVALANTRDTVAASVWTENVSLAVDVACRIQAGTVWVNCTHVFDAAGGLGGYRHGGFGLEGSEEGMREYLKPASRPQPLPWPQTGSSAPESLGPRQQGGGIPEGGRDVHAAVQAARAALPGWARSPGHVRAQVLYSFAENLQARQEEFAARIARMTGDHRLAELEVRRAVERVLTYAAWADKLHGGVRPAAHPGVLALALREPTGVVGIACPDEFPLLALVSLVAPALAAGNTVVAVPSPRFPGVAPDLRQVLDAAEVPSGVVNLLTGDRDALAVGLAQHEDVDAVWYFGSEKGAAAVERESAGDLKETWTCTQPWDWLDPRWAEGREFFRRATRVKTVWIPHGE